MSYCQEKLQWLAEYKIRTLEFSQGVSKLYGKWGRLGETEHAALVVAAELARLKCEHARLGLEQHIAAHRCEE